MGTLLRPPGQKTSMGPGFPVQAVDEKILEFLQRLYGYYDAYKPPMEVSATSSTERKDRTIAVSLLGSTFCISPSYALHQLALLIVWVKSWYYNRHCTAATVTSSQIPFKDSIKDPVLS